MNFDKIEQAYERLLANIQNIQNGLGTNIYDAMIEQNAAYVAGQHELASVRDNNAAVKALDLSKEEWRRVYQFLFIKANQTEPMQYNHQFTPDAIGIFLTYLMDQLAPAEHLDVLEIGSGTGNLAQTLLNHTEKTVDYFGIEMDDLLIDLSASIADVIGLDIGLAQGDAVRPQLLKPSDVIISDLPIGYYPDDRIAARYEVAVETGHTYAHHLLMEQSLKYLKRDGLAIFLAPNTLLTSEQSGQLKKWLTQHAQLLVMVTLPETLFGASSMDKSIFVLRKQTQKDCETFIYPLQSLQDSDHVKHFMENFKKWREDNAI